MASDDFAQICNLPGEELEKRRAMIKTEIAPHVRGTEELPNGLAWEFARSPALRARLERLVALEQQCCGGLEWRLESPQGADTLRLVVLGVDPSSEAFASFRVRT